MKSRDLIRQKKLVNKTPYLLAAIKWLQKRNIYWVITGVRLLVITVFLLFKHPPTRVITIIRVRNQQVAPPPDLRQTLLKIVTIG